VALVFTGGGVGRRTSNELEGLGLDRLVGVNFRNGTHFGDVYSEHRKTMAMVRGERSWEGKRWDVG
jgi:hypothetical protein